MQVGSDDLQLATGGRAVEGQPSADAARKLWNCTAGWTGCAACPAASGPPRQALDQRLRAANADWDAIAGTMNPDGDADLADELVIGFRVVGCLGCGGVLKPDVIFFGEDVPRDRVAECFALTETASLLLVLGSSLTVQSGYRFVRRATGLGIPVAIINQGPTRGDAEATLTLDAPLGPALTALAGRLPDR